jgi:hypothetical protein
MGGGRYWFFILVWFYQCPGWAFFGFPETQLLFATDPPPKLIIQTLYSTPTHTQRHLFSFQQKI